MNARRAIFSIEYVPGRTGDGSGAAGDDVTRDLSPFLLRASFTDRAHGEADTVDLVFDDGDGRFTGRPPWSGPAWAPAQGDRFRLSLTCLDWFEDGDTITLPWGTFEADELEEEIGSGSTLTVRGQSASVLGTGAGGFRSSKRSQAWEGLTLRAIASDLAAQHGLALGWFAPDGEPLARVDQSDEADATFLRRLCERAGLLFSVRETAADGGVRLVIADEGGLAEQPAVTIRPTDCADRRLRRSIHGRFKAAKCSYWDARKGELVEAEVRGTGYTESSEVLEVRARVGTVAEARALAGAALRRENRAGSGGRIRLAIGRPDLSAGSVVQLVGFGLMDGRYLVDEATHSYGDSGGYTTEIEVAGL